MLRKCLLFIGWLSIVGSFIDGGLLLYSIWIVIVNESVSMNVSLDGFLKNHVGFIYWVKQIAFYVMPNSIVSWLFNLPSLVYFPSRILMSLVIGWWALKKAHELSEEYA